MSDYDIAYCLHCGCSEEDHLMPDGRCENFEKDCDCEHFEYE